MMKTSYSLFLAPPHTRQRAHGFTLVEMIVVMVITGIIGGMVAVFIRAPVQGYVDSARRAEMTDIADTALRRMSRDLRLALPNSVRVTQVGTVSYLEFIPTTGGGRYRTGPPGDELNFTTDTSFDVLGPPVTMQANDQIVVCNLGLTGLDAYAGTSRRAYTGGAATINNIAINASTPFPAKSPGNRFQVIATPVTYVCAPAGGGGGTLTRYWGYSIQATQPNITDLLQNGAASALLATNVGLASGAGGCSFQNFRRVIRSPVNLAGGDAGGCGLTYPTNVVAQRSDLVTMQLTITESGESVTLYNSTHVNNEP